MKPATWMALLGLWATVAVAAPDPSLSLDRIDGNTLIFQSGKPLKTNLFELKFLGVLRESGEPPFLVISGRNCKDCSTELQVHLVRRDGELTQTFVHPGKVTDPKTGNILLESRAFFGKCLPGQAESYVVLQKELIEKKRRGARIRTTETSLFTAQPEAGRLSEKLTELRSVGSMTSRQREVLRQVKANRCTEVPGTSRLATLKPFDVKVHRLDIEAEDDAEEDEPETSQTAGTAAAAGGAAPTAAQASAAPGAEPEDEDTRPAALRLE